MPVDIYRFINSLTGQIDFEDWREDLAGRFLVDYRGPANGTTIHDLYRIYFGSGGEDFERKTLLGQQLQIVRWKLLTANIPVFLRYHRRSRRWYVVDIDDTGGARGFIMERAKRLVALYSRLRTYSDVGQRTYSLPAADPLVAAIEGASPIVKQIEGIINEIEDTLELPEPRSA